MATRGALEVVDLTGDDSENGNAPANPRLALASSRALEPRPRSRASIVDPLTHRRPSLLDRLPPAPPGHEQSPRSASRLSQQTPASTRGPKSNHAYVPPQTVADGRSRPLAARATSVLDGLSPATPGHEEFPSRASRSSQHTPASKKGKKQDRVNLTRETEDEEEDLIRNGPSVMDGFTPAPPGYEEYPRQASLPSQLRRNRKRENNEPESLLDEGPRPRGRAPSFWSKVRADFHKPEHLAMLGSSGGSESEDDSDDDEDIRAAVGKKLLSRFQSQPSGKKAPNSRMLDDDDDDDDSGEDALAKRAREYRERRGPYQSRLNVPSLKALVARTSNEMPGTEKDETAHRPHSRLYSEASGLRYSDPVSLSSRLSQPSDELGRNSIQNRNERGTFATDQVEKYDKGRVGRITPNLTPRLVMETSDQTERFQRLPVARNTGIPAPQAVKAPFSRTPTKFVVPPGDDGDDNESTSRPQSREKKINITEAKRLARLRSENGNGSASKSGYEILNKHDDDEEMDDDDDFALLVAPRAVSTLSRTGKRRAEMLDVSPERNFATRRLGHGVEHLATAKKSDPFSSRSSQMSKTLDAAAGADMQSRRTLNASLLSFDNRYGESSTPVGKGVETHKNGESDLVSKYRGAPFVSSPIFVSSAADRPKEQGGTRGQISQVQSPSVPSWAAYHSNRQTEGNSNARPSSKHSTLMSSSKEQHGRVPSTAPPSLSLDVGTSISGKENALPRHTTKVTDNTPRGNTRDLRHISTDNNLFNQRLPTRSASVQEMDEPTEKPAAKQTRIPFTEEDNALLLKLKQRDGLSWAEIKMHFPNRTLGSLQVHYTKLKHKLGHEASVRASNDDVAVPPSGTSHAEDTSVAASIGRVVQPAETSHVEESSVAAPTNNPDAQAPTISPMTLDRPLDQYTHEELREWFLSVFDPSPLFPDRVWELSSASSSEDEADSDAELSESSSTKRARATAEAIEEAAYQRSLRKLSLDSLSTKQPRDQPKSNTAKRGRGRPRGLLRADAQGPNRGSSRAVENSDAPLSTKLQLDIVRGAVQSHNLSKDYADALNGRYIVDQATRTIYKVERTDSSVEDKVQDDIARHLRHRELGQTRSAAANLRKSVHDVMQKQLTHESGMSGDAHVVAWAPGGNRFAVGAVATSDEASMQYNRPLNLFLGDFERATLKELPRHRVNRPITKAGPNSTREMYVSQDPKLYMTVTGVKFDPTGKMLFSAGYDNTVHLWDVNRESNASNCLVTLPHKAHVDVIDVSPWTGLLATGCKVSGPTAVTIFNCSFDSSSATKMGNFASERAVKSFDHRISPSCLRWGLHAWSQHYLLGGFMSHPSEAIKSTMGDACLWDVQHQRSIPVRFARAISDVAWNPNPTHGSAHFAVAGVAPATVNRGTKTILRLFGMSAVDANYRTHELECPAADINDVVWNPYDDNLIAAACTDGKVYVWDLRAENKVLHTLKHDVPLAPMDENGDREVDDPGVRFSAWGVDRRRLLTGSSDGVIKSWDPYRAPEDAHQHDMVTMKSGIMAGAFSPDFSSLLIGEESGTVSVFSVGFNKKPASARNTFTVKHATPPNANSNRLGGVEVARNMLENREMVIRPLGPLPIRQAVQGPRYKGPFDHSRDAEDLRKGAWLFQNSYYQQMHEVDPLGLVPVFSLNEEPVDSGRSQDRIPFSLRSFTPVIHGLQGSLMINQVACRRCQAPTRKFPDLHGKNDKSEKGDPLCERCAFACFHCGYPLQLHWKRDVTFLACTICDIEWQGECLGYRQVTPDVQVVEMADSKDEDSAVAYEAEELADDSLMEELADYYHSLWN